MARIRSVKPEMRRSLTVCSWQIPVRWTFVGLLGYVDDYGRGLDDLRLMKAELYPLDDALSPRRIDAHLRTIADNGPLCRYEVAGQRYLHVVSWEEHQRVSHPTDSRIPPCPMHEKDGSAPEPLRNPLPNDSGNAHEPFPPRARAEQGREGSREGKGEERLVTGSQSVPDRTTSANGDRPQRAGVAVVQRTLGCDERWATKVIDDVLARAPAGVTNEGAYVLAAIRERPEDYRPTRLPPSVHDLCHEHGRERATCPPSWHQEQP